MHPLMQCGARHGFTHGIDPFCSAKMEEHGLKHAHNAVAFDVNERFDGTMRIAHPSQASTFKARTTVKFGRAISVQKYHKRIVQAEDDHPE